MNKILIPIDGSEYSMRAAEFAAEFIALNPEVKVLVFTVDRLPQQFMVRDLYWVSSDIGESVRHIQEVFAEVREANFKKAVTYFNQKGLNVQCDYTFGNPAEEITHYASKNGVDMIIMGTRGLSSLKEVFLGSVSHKVLQLSTCPVLLVK